METWLSFQTQEFAIKKIEITTISAKGKGISIFLQYSFHVDMLAEIMEYLLWEDSGKNVSIESIKCTC